MLPNRAQLLTTVHSVRAVLTNTEIESIDKARAFINEALEESPVVALTLAFEAAFRRAYHQVPEYVAISDALTTALVPIRARFVKDGIGFDTEMEDHVRFVCAAKTFVIMDDQGLDPTVASILGIAVDDGDDEKKGGPTYRPEWAYGSIHWKL